ncbi:hypothetical protein KUTeg_016666 [Tegillarca granosa]|uniref:THO complex subunit 1 n=1 Tax=Tegillarca granosa TaxID=220873 RepID=A0ABQ9EP21_TEGGR|nr:hypothetical protein KUTeg_016666 [Tegillarca granosa]
MRQDLNKIHVENYVTPLFVTHSLTKEENDSEKKLVTDQTLRDYTLNLEDVQDCSVYKKITSFAIKLAKSDLCATSVPILLLSDIFDVITLDQCEDLFNLVEENLSTWKSICLGDYQSHRTPFSVVEFSCFYRDFSLSQKNQVDVKEEKMEVEEGEMDELPRIQKPFSNLLDLQLNDSNFRRYVLVQFLILFQYLNAQVKFKSTSQQLGEEQSQWVRNTQEQVYQLIKETPPDGEVFAKTVESKKKMGR